MESNVTSTAPETRSNNAPATSLPRPPVAPMQRRSTASSSSRPQVAPSTRSGSLGQASLGSSSMTGGARERVAGGPSTLPAPRPHKSPGAPLTPTPRTTAGPSSSSPSSSLPSSSQPKPSSSSISKARVGGGYGASTSTSNPPAPSLNRITPNPPSSLNKGNGRRPGVMPASSLLPPAVAAAAAAERRAALALAESQAISSSSSLALAESQAVPSSSSAPQPGSAPSGHLPLPSPPHPPPPLITLPPSASHASIHGQVLRPPSCSFREQAQNEGEGLNDILGRVRRVAGPSNPPAPPPPPPSGPSASPSSRSALPPSSSSSSALRPTPPLPSSSSQSPSSRPPQPPSQPITAPRRSNPSASLAASLARLSSAAEAAAASGSSVLSALTANPPNIPPPRNPSRLLIANTSSSSASASSNRSTASPSAPPPPRPNASASAPAPASQLGGGLGVDVDEDAQLALAIQMSMEDQRSNPLFSPPLPVASNSSSSFSSLPLQHPAATTLSLALPFSSSSSSTTSSAPPPPQIDPPSSNPPPSDSPAPPRHWTEHVRVPPTNSTSHPSPSNGEGAGPLAFLQSLSGILAASGGTGGGGGGGGLTVISGPGGISMVLGGGLGGGLLFGLSENDEGEIESFLDRRRREREGLGEGEGGREGRPGPASPSRAPLDALSQMIMARQMSQNRQMAMAQASIERLSAESGGILDHFRGRDMREINPYALGLPLPLARILAAQSMAFRGSSEGGMVVRGPDGSLIDLNSYEGRLAGLTDVVVTAPQSVIDSLESVAYLRTPQTRSSNGGQADICTICQSECEEGEMVTHLRPCKHLFHHDCVKQWLSGYNKRCPVCKEEVL